MNAADLVAALDLPSSCRVDQRVPKKLLVENGAPTATDKRWISEGVEEIYWVAALKPTTIGVSEYRDELREYLEIALISVTLRPDAKATRLAELVHRAIPYPVVLMMIQGDGLTLSLAHKRGSQGEADKMVLDGEPVFTDLNTTLDSELVGSFLASLPMSRQPRTTLYTLYQGWIDTVLALQLARVTGAFMPADSPEHAAVRRTALLECVTLETKIASLRTAATKEKQINKQVELNLELKRLQAAQAAVRIKL
jgi:Domain of unknown function (DUF4391)